MGPILYQILRGAPLRRVALGCALMMISVPGSSRAQVVDGVAAVVNNKVITFSQVRKEVDATEAQYRELFAGVELIEKIREARLAALRALIERELIIQEFDEKGYFIPENVIEERIRGIVRDSYDNDRAALIRTLQANGMSVSGFKEQIRSQIVVQAMRGRNVASSVIVSPYQIEQYYQNNIRQFVQPDQVKLRMIYLRRGVFTEQRAAQDGAMREVDPQRLIMEEILAKVQTGSDFASLARGYSESPQRAAGGDMGWVTDATLRAELAREAFQLLPGQNSGIIETDDGYHILLVEEIRKATVVALSDVRERIENTLLQQERERLQQEWLDGLRSRAFIKMFF